jgi:hypothetical protein
MPVDPARTARRAMDAHHQSRRAGLGTVADSPGVTNRRLGHMLPSASDAVLDPSVQALGADAALNGRDACGAPGETGPSGSSCKEYSDELHLEAIRLENRICTGVPPVQVRKVGDRQVAPP